MVPRSSSKEAAARRLRESIREKVVCWLKDVWRPYHGSTYHREEDDGNRIVEKKKSGGHMPLNAAVIQLWDETKLSSSRDLIMRELYRLAVGTPAEVRMFAEIQDLFGRYGAGDSDYDNLKEQARREREAGSSAPSKTKPPSRRAVTRRQPVMGRQKRATYADASVPPASCKIETQIRLYAVETGIDLITERLIEAGVTNKDLWADFPLPFIPTTRSKTADEEKQKRYLAYLDWRDKLIEEKNPDGSRRHKRVTNKALLMAAEECGVSKQTIITAVQDYESGYLRIDVT